MPTIGGAQIYPDLEVWVENVTAIPNQQNAVIPIYMKNYTDTVAGVELWLLLNRPDRIEFQHNTDTIIDTSYLRCIDWNGPICEDTIFASWYWVCTHWNGSMCVDSSMQLGYWHCNQEDSGHCIDSTWVPGYDWRIIDSFVVQTGNFDTSGTLLSGWEYVESRSLGGHGYDIKITAVANMIPPPYTNGIGFPPQPGDNRPLIKILADVYDISPSDTDRTVDIMIQWASLEHFGFSDQAGNTIGIITDTVPDTNWYECIQWGEPPNDTICLEYHEVSGPPADSIYVSLVLVAHLDTTKVSLEDGSLTILAGICGDVNNNGKINAIDVTYLVNYLYKGGPPPPLAYLADMNGKPGINALDVTYFINYLYKGGPEPDCW
jgi:hypothetical protein